jgi:hypothetical protein
MKNEATGNRQQGTEPIENLLRKAVPRIEENPEPPHDLWPAMQARLKSQPKLAAKLRSVPWFDWVLAGGLAIFAIAFPAAMPMLLYYL